MNTKNFPGTKWLKGNSLSLLSGSTSSMRFSSMHMRRVINKVLKGLSICSKLTRKFIPKWIQKMFRMFRTPIRLTHMANCVLHRSSHSQKFFKVEALGCSRNIHRKVPVLESLFNKVGGLKTWNFIIKRLQRRCFPVNIAKFLRAFFMEHLQWLLQSTDNPRSYYLI